MDGIFSAHLLKPISAGPVVNPRENQVWPSVFLLTCLLLLVFVKSRGMGRLVKLVQSTFSKQTLQQLEREQSTGVKMISGSLNAFYLLNFSFLVFKLNRHFPCVLVQAPQLLQFLFFLGVLMSMLLLRNLAISILAYFTDCQSLFSDYRSSSSFLNQTFGLFIFPCVVLAEFTDLDPMIFVYIAWVILFFSFVLRWYRGMMMSLVEERIGLLQIFSYFCGLEILPLFVVIKFIIQTL